MTVWTRQKVLRRATGDDIPAIMDIERRPGYELLVGRWDEAQHRHNISKPGYLYFVHDDAEGHPIAFAALSGIGHRDREVYLNRMIVRTPGQGTGSRVLKAIMETVFEGTPAERLCLRVLPENARALALYRGHGFTQQRILPKAGTRPDGVQVDLLLMTIEREEWEERAR